MHEVVARRLAVVGLLGVGQGLLVRQPAVEGERRQERRVLAPVAVRLGGQRPEAVLQGALQVRAQAPDLGVHGALQLPLEVVGDLRQRAGGGHPATRRVSVNQAARVEEAAQEPREAPQTPAEDAGGSRAGSTPHRRVPGGGTAALVVA
jgi:hypothetical protein